MKKYIVILEEKAKGCLNDDLLELHVQHLKALKNKGNLFLCGPFKDNDGALQIILANTFEETEKLIQSDPFIANKYYRKYTIHELIEANDDNNYLMEDTQTKINLKKNV